ncbi:DUF6093 family protein [Microbacterium sp. YY-01]|uniref:DUF6093 family protein n=1 Tax=Microbacterium sp. YY-01 TaxID=3421634 RepID=UPI003D183589
MSLGSDIEAELPALRAEAESRMTETVEFFTVTPGHDPVTLKAIKIETVLKTSVRARVKAAKRDARDVAVGGQTPVLSQTVLSVPVGSHKTAPSEWVRVTASTADDGLVGTTYRVADYPTLGQVTAWRCPIEQTS